MWPTNRAFGFSNQGYRLRSCFFGKQVDGELRDNLPLTIREGAEINPADTVTIQFCRSSDTHDLLLTG